METLIEAPRMIKDILNESKFVAFIAKEVAKISYS